MSENKNESHATEHRGATNPMLATGADVPLRDCPESPNCGCTLATRPSQRMLPLRYVGQLQKAEEVIERVVVPVVERLPRTKIVESRGDYLHVVFKTMVFRFRDDVEFYYDVALRQLHFRSASRIGYSDMGANRRRMESLCQRLCEYDFTSEAD